MSISVKETLVAAVFFAALASIMTISVAGMCLILGPREAEREIDRMF